MEDVEEKELSENLEGDFYKKAEEYWENIDPTVNGVLGGFGFISKTDIQGSAQFLKSILQGPNRAGKVRALDCGAGVGRITQELLINHFKAVDLVEQNQKFLEEAKINLSKTQHTGNFYQIGLQNFKATEKYDVIWCQWVLGHLTDDDLVLFLRMCCNSLAPNGFIIVKENLAGTPEEIKDDKDSSVTRPAHQYVQIFRKAGLRIVKQAKQSNFPSQLFTVKIFGLQPVASK